MFGKQIRWSRFFGAESGFGLLVPIDHGLTMGPIDGLQSLSEMASWIGHHSITGIIAHKGMVRRLAERRLLPRAGLMMHLNGMISIAPDPDRKELMTRVASAARMGADAVSIQINFDGHNDAHNLTMLGSVVDDAQELGLPVLTMVYDKCPQTERAARWKRIRHLARAAVELGTDALKLSAPQDGEEMARILDGLAEHTSVFFAGGSLCSDEAMLALAGDVVARGAAGVCIGRNIFQRPDPCGLLEKIGEVLHRPAKKQLLQAGVDNGWQVAAGQSVAAISRAGKPAG